MDEKARFSLLDKEAVRGEKFIYQIFTESKQNEREHRGSVMGPLKEMVNWQSRARPPDEVSHAYQVREFCSWRLIFIWSWASSALGKIAWNLRHPLPIVWQIQNFLSPLPDLLTASLPIPSLAHSALPSFSFYNVRSIGTVMEMEVSNNVWCFHLVWWTVAIASVLLAKGSAFFLFLLSWRYQLCWDIPRILVWGQHQITGNVSSSLHHILQHLLSRHAACVSWDCLWPW